MEFKTKYNVGDMVYLMRNNKVHTDNIEFVKIHAANESSPLISYGLRAQDVSEKPIPEHLLFATKEELLASL